MKRFALFAILLYIFLNVCPGQTAELLDRDKIRAESIYKLIETEESFDVLRTFYRDLLQVAESTDDQRMQSECMFQIARIYYWQTKYSLSLSETKKGMEIAKQLDDNELLAVGYDLLARLHYLFSPEQALYYYRKCWMYCEQSDSVELSVSHLGSYNVILNYDDIVLDDLLSIDLAKLKPLHKARISYLIARSMTAAGRIDDAAGYLANTHEYLLQHSGACPLNVKYEQLMADISLRHGDTKLAWGYLEKSNSIISKNKIQMELVQNYMLGSEIAQAEGHDEQALQLYRKSVLLRDSIFNSVPNKYFPDDLVNTMMQYMAEDKSQASKKNTTAYCIISIFVLVLGACLLYYFKSSNYQEKSYVALSGIKVQTANGFNSKLKSHLMKIMYSYKAGVNYCMKHKLDADIHPDKADKSDYSALLDKHSRKADVLLYTLLDWVESEPNMQPHYADVDAREVIEQIVGLFEIAFVSKHLPYQLSVGDKPLMVNVDQVMFALMIEHLFFKTIKSATKNSTIYVSAQKDNMGNFMFHIFDPENKEHGLEKDIFAQRTANFEKSEHATRTADWDFNIFAECSYRNRATFWLEFSSDTGTTYHLKVFPFETPSNSPCR